jgi:hypothetical protein
MEPAGTMFLAHHALLLAIPAFAPAIAVVGVILYAAIRDRRADRHPDDGKNNAP